MPDILAATDTTDLGHVSPPSLSMAMGGAIEFDETFTVCKFQVQFPEVINPAVDMIDKQMILGRLWAYRL
jgi:hypothetical protein